MISRRHPADNFSRLTAGLCAGAILLISLVATLGARTMVERGLLGLLASGLVFFILSRRAATFKANQQLCASEAQFRDFADMAADWYWEMGPDLRFTYQSGRFEEVLGVDPALVIGKYRADLVDADNPPPGWREHLEDLRERRMFRNFRYAARLPNGTVRHCKISGKPLFGAAGEFLGYRGTGTDVTKEVLSEQSAVDARRLLDSALETISEGFVLFDPQDRLVLCNAPYREVYAKIADLLVPGARFEDLVRAKVERGDVPEARKAPEEWIEKRLAQHRARKNVHERRRTDGHWLRIQESRLADGGYVGIHTDITETKYREIELGEQVRRNALFAAAITTATSGIAISDAKLADHPIIYINPMFTTIMGYGEDDAIGLSYESLYCTDADPAAHETIQAAIANGRSAEVRTVSFRKDGRCIYLDLRVAPVTNRDGRVTHFVWIQNDVTSQVLADHKLRESDERTRRQAALLQDAVDALPEGFVLFDEDDQLQLFNEKYLQLRGYDRTIAIGAPYETILRSAIERGEISVPPDEVDAWIAERARCHRDPTDTDSAIMQLGGRWVRLSERKTRDGGIVSVITDITELKSAEARLRESEEHTRRQAEVLQDAVDAMPDGFVLYDADDRVVMCNRKFRELRRLNPLSGKVGTKFEDILRNAVACGEVPMPAEGVDAWVQKRLAERRAGAGTMITERRGRWLRMSEERTRDGGIVAIHTDITALKDAEAQIRESEERAQQQAALLQDAIDAMPDGFVLYDADDRVVMCNRKFRELRAANPVAFVPGVQFETALRSALAKGTVQVPPDEGPGPEEWIRFRMEQRRQLSTKPVVRVNHSADGWIRISQSRTSEGGIVAIHADISEMKEAEAKLRDNEERIRSLAANLPGVLFQRVILPDGSVRHTYLSERAVDIFGYSAEEIVANPLWMDEIIDPESVSSVQAMLKQTRADLKPAEYEYKFKRRDGEVRWARAMVAPRRTTAGDVIWDGVVFDITGQKQLEDQRHELETQLRHAQKIEALGTLAGGIAHDINNTLVPVVALSKLTLRGLPADSPHREAMQTVVEASTHIRDLVKQILAFSRKGKTEAQPVQLQGVISDVARLLTASLKPDIQIARSVDDSVGPVKCDETQIHQVLMNLCTNAGHAIGDVPGTIRISLDAMDISESAGTSDNLVSGRYARLQVADTGCGMDARTLQRVFEPFFTTKKVGEGTGLGLSVVHGIVTNHGGRITVDSEPGRGTTFTVLLPLYAEGADEGMPSASSAGITEPAVS